MAKRQYIVDRRKVKPGQSEMELAALVRKGLGLDVSPERLKEFILHHFTLLSILCHEIYGAANDQ